MKNSTTMYYPTEPRNILMVSVPADIKSPLPLLTQLLISGLQQLGYTVTLSSCWGSKKEGESVIQKLVQRSRDIRHILQQARRGSFQLVYVHSSLDRRALLRDLPLAAALRFQKAPSVIIFHGCDLKKLQSRSPSLFSLGTWLLFKLVSGILVDSTEEQSVLLKRWPWAKVGVVPQPMMSNPVKNAVRFQEARIEKTPVLLFAGRLIAEKGVKEVLEAFLVVRSRIPCKLVIAGDGPLNNALQQMAANHPDLQDSIEFTGYLDRTGMWELYRRCDVLLLPTYHAEGMPTVILEAMASGLGLICTPIRGAADYLLEGKNVFFVPPQRADLLASRIIELLSKPDLLNQMKEANLVMSRTFEPKSAAHRQLEVIQSFGLRL